MKKAVLSAPLLILPLFLLVFIHKAGRTGLSDFRDAPSDGAALAQLSGTSPYAVPASPAAPAAPAEEDAAARCAPPAAGENYLSEEDFDWNYYPLPEMLRRFEEIYVAPKRLPLRAYWDGAAKSIRLPSLEDQGGAVTIPPAFIRAVTGHIEKALELKYADAVFFPDMGHAHFLIPDRSWRAKYGRYPVKRTSVLYRELLRDPAVKLLYHTAEQLRVRGADGQLLSDEHTRFRFLKRNISGFLRADSPLEVHQNPASRHNVVDEVPGYRKWGGLSVSAHKDGCFAYRAGGRSYRYDLSLFDIPETSRPATAAKSRAADKPQPAKLRYAPECILKAVAKEMGQQYRPDVPMPKIFFEGAVPLQQFQDAAEPQWGQRPARFSNLYAQNDNEIYLIDDADWYARVGGRIDDALAHEFVHYIQHRYRGWDLTDDDPLYEPQAREVQIAFRDNFIKKPGSCPPD